MGGGSRSRPIVCGRIPPGRNREKGFRIGNLLSVFVKPDGPPIDESLRKPPGYNLKAELFNGRVKDLTKNECLILHDPHTKKHTSCFATAFQEEYVGNYKNRVFAQPVKDWTIAYFKEAYDFLGGLMEMRTVADVVGEFPQSWGAAYRRFFLDLTRAESQRLEISVLTPGELRPVYSRD